jgi:hypothetical protein
MLNEITLLLDHAGRSVPNRRKAVVRWSLLLGSFPAVSSSEPREYIRPVTLALVTSSFHAKGYLNMSTPNASQEVRRFLAAIGAKGGKTGTP